MKENELIRVALVDDHTLFRKGLVSLIEIIGRSYKVLFEADNGVDMQHKIDAANLPHIIIMDVNMPGMDGFASVQWVRKNYPSIKILVLSMIEDERTIVRMLKLGVSGYLGKDAEPMQLADALDAVMNKGFYYTDFITGKLVHSIATATTDTDMAYAQLLNVREKEFLSYCCTELTYHEIAEKMFVSQRTIEGYRSSVCEKLKIRGRVGLVIYAVKNGLIAYP
jgi:two-component system, NarL family, invasion response regulator UvrY